MVSGYFDYHTKAQLEYGENALVIMQCGGFYELYETDDEGPDLSKIRDLTGMIKTKKNKNATKITKKSPYMLGFPESALNRWVKFLLKHGYIIVIYKQHKIKKGNKIDVDRKIDKVYSIGTFIDDVDDIENKNTNDLNNNIVSIFIQDEKQMDGTYLSCIGATSIDLKTGTSYLLETYPTSNDKNLAYDELYKFIKQVDPVEILINHKKNTNNSMTEEQLITYFEIQNINYSYSDTPNKKYKKLDYITKLFTKVYPNTGLLNVFEYLEIERTPYVMISLAMLFDHVYHYDNNILNNIKRPIVLNKKKYLNLGNDACYQLDIFRSNKSENITNGNNCLFNIVNNTKTAIGHRYLRYRLNNPLLSMKKLNKIYSDTEKLMTSDENIKTKVTDLLSCVYDVEKMVRKLNSQILRPSELFKFMFSLTTIKKLSLYLKSKKFTNKFVLPNNVLKEIDELQAYYRNTFDETKIINEHTLNYIEQNIFNKNKYQNIDVLVAKLSDNRDLLVCVRDELAKYIVENKKTSEPIKIISKDQTLSLSNNRLQILEEQLKKVESIKITENLCLYPKDFQYRRNKASSRIIIEELRSNSQDKDFLIEELRFEIFEKIKLVYIEMYDKYKNLFSSLIKYVKYIDYINSSCITASKYNYTKPLIKEHENGYIDAVQLRHPIIERLRDDCEYIPHDIKLGNREDNELEGMLIFGLNSSGKSSLMKAVGLSIVMAQSGLYVPAKTFEYSPYDNVFTRISGSDNLFKGYSSFTYEMIELNNILQRTGKKTLVLGDEVCKGTEHVSGVAIVAATLMQLAKTKSSFMFATHLHELAHMEEINNLSNVKCFHLTVEHDKESDTLIFDRILKEGSGPSLYGIVVAKYIISDLEFMRNAQTIQNKILNQNTTLVNNKSSKYNNKLIIDKCQVCSKEYTKEQPLDTHHINFQSKCSDGFVTGKPHICMNEKYNLVVLCKKCHTDVHNDVISIDGYMDTTSGPKLKINKKPEIKKNHLGNKKYNTEQLDIILSLKGTSKTLAKKMLSQKHDINISVGTIKKIWDNDY